ncbi:hypothetical protein D5086_024440 [Populus alba]|uniref:Uncharacterized protein n=1 Tax=Populus alba TaxID=43335 RepID=A0ACC4B5Z2_POPAL
MHGQNHNSRPELHTSILHLIIVGKYNNSYTYDLLALTMIACCVLQCAGSWAEPVYSALFSQQCCPVPGHRRNKERAPKVSTGTAFALFIGQGKMCSGKVFCSFTIPRSSLNCERRSRLRELMVLSF